MEELPHVLWAHRTMIKSSNEDTPFSLTYGTKAVISIEIRMPTLRTAEVDLVQNDEALGINLDLLEEKRKQAAIREAKMEKYYNSKVQSLCFKPRDLVYCNNDASRAKDTGKLAPNGKDRTKLRKHLGRIRENVAAQRLALVGVWTSLSEPLSVTSLIGEASTSGMVPAASVTTTALSTTFTSVSSIPLISTDDYDILGVDGQEGTGTDGRAVADENVATFPMLMIWNQISLSDSFNCL
nr:reverse transcriptase domain-containing protein [Tanacetum cinerariifolium]